MNLFWYWAGLSLTFLAGWFMEQSVSYLLEVKDRWWSKLLLYIGSWLLNAMIIFIGDWVNIIPTILLFLGSVWISCEGSRLKKLTIGLMLASTMFSFNALNDNFIQAYLNSSFIGRVLFAWLLFVSIRHFAPEKEYELTKAMWRLLLLLTITPIGIVLSVIVIPKGNDVRYESGNVYAILLMLALFSFIGLLWTVIVLARQRKLEQANIMAEMNRKYYETMEQQNFEIRRLKHDMANHLQVLTALSGEKKDSYIQKLLDNPAVSHILRYCGDETVNAVLSSKKTAMDQKQILFQFHIDISEELSFEKTDICALLGNALDNAIEACEQLPQEKRKIQLDLCNRKGMFVLKVSNSTVMKELEEGKLPITHKADKKAHGLGLRSMKEIVKRNHGEFEIELKDGIFTLFVYMPDPVIKSE